jgi:hypothetical protein
LLTREQKLWGPALIAALLAISFTRDRNPMPSSSRSIVQLSKRDHGRGRLASAPSEIPARGWKDILLRVWNNIGEDRVMLVAAGKMRNYFAPAIAFALMVSGILCARSDDIPTLDVRPVCHGIASQSGLEVGLQQTSLEQCVQSEQAVREQLKKEWSTFSTADKSHCVALAKTGGESSYTELVTCMEMSRDVRALRSAEAASSRAATTRTPSSPSTATVQPVASTPTPTPAPAPADTAARSSSPKEPVNSDVDSTLKELQRLKTDAQNARIDAQNARTSEALTKRKLADTEADLKRAKDEAGQTSKQAELARADAQSAREAQARAENKL